MTNIGNLPGYYYDEEKKKYFKIQKNHVVPLGSKHAESNVNREERRRKKQKRHDDLQAHKNKQTVRRSNTLQSPVLRFGLTREIGAHSRASNRKAGDEFVLNRMEPQTITFKIPHAPRPQIVNAQSIQNDQLNVLVCRFSPKSYCIYVNPTPAMANEQTNKQTSWQFSEKMSPNMAFSSIVVSLSLGQIDSNTGVQRYLACTRTAGSQGHLYLGQFDRDTSTTSPVGTFISLSHQQSVWSSAYEPVNNRYAISSSEAIYLLDEDRLSKHPNSNAETSWDNDSYRGITWLDAQTIAFSTRANPDKTTQNGEISLWDIRSRDTALRFSAKRVFTGLQTPAQTSSSNGVHLLASTNRTIHLFDTRLAHKPLLSFTHSHQGPELQFTVAKPGYIAAFDRDNEFQIYSVRTGRHVRTLSVPQSGLGSLVVRPGYFEDRRGAPFFQACLDDGVVRWRLFDE